MTASSEVTDILAYWLARLSRGTLFVLSGPSGAGKGTLCRQWLANEPDVQLSISATTRIPRTGEIDGVHYYFSNRADFEQQVRQDCFLEWAEVHGSFYGTPRQPVERALAEGRHVLLEIDVQGGLQVKRCYPEAALIFVLPPSLEELTRRLYSRGTDSREAIEQRLRVAVTEFTYIEKYDYCIINDRIERAVAHLRAIAAAEKGRVYR
ncbi:MAG: guanylate kinase [Heliobacteriaceae bacterium]|nr:guanylate kinase [Heliobacteriaceae bacterium]MDD4586975.1 guanylate kinase [Heliobacteriaceae bacterium]